MERKKFISRRGLLICILLTMAANTFAANGLPFHDKLEFYLTMIKVVGGFVAAISFLIGIYFHKQGRSDSLMHCIWFGGAGILTANLEWLAEKSGFLQGILF